MTSDRFDQEALTLHKKHLSSIGVRTTVPLDSKHALSVWYTPGVAAPCREIARRPEAVYELTMKSNTLAVITDGSRVLGLGNIGPMAAIPVMQGKCALFNTFGGINAFPLCLNTRSTDEFVAAVKAVEPILGAVNLEDISVPECYTIETALIRELDIPVFHDDQHGTAVVVYAGLINALKLMGRDLSGQRVVISGAGASGSANAKLLVGAGAGEVIVCDRKGALYEGRPDGMRPDKAELARLTNKERFKGSLKEALVGADIFIGLAAPGLVDGADIARMHPKPIVLACANPVPDIEPEAAKAAGAAVVGTGRSDLPNQINNVLAFPGILRGAMDARARLINEAMKLAAAQAIADILPAKELAPEKIIVEPFQKGVAAAVARAVTQAAIASGVSRCQTPKVPE